jgi:hypothetical protein
MNRDLEKLLGGFAADTLTPEERQQLFTAALHDQQLFNALADEQALKELLADPAVRRRLLQALNEAGSAPRVSSVSWFDSFRRPANLALAGGLATAAFAIVLGTKIYQDSVRQSSPSLATESSGSATPSPAAPSAPEPVPPPPAVPEMKAEEDRAPAPPARTKQEASADKPARQEPISPAEVKHQGAPDLTRKNAAQSERDDLPLPSEPPASLGKAAKETALSADQNLGPVSPPAAAVPAPKVKQETTVPATDTPAPGALAPVAGARALFYAFEPDRLDQQTERAPRLKPSAEARRSLRSEPKTQRFAAAVAPQFKPLGLRYGFAIRTGDGTAQETDAATALKSGDQARLTIEVNQDAFVQIWKTAGSSAPQLWFPTKEPGQISKQVPAGRRQSIPLSQENEPYTLTVRLSRVPFGPLPDQEPVTLVVPSNQLQERVIPDDSTGSQEQATYVVNTNPSPTVQLIAEIPIGPGN